MLYMLFELRELHVVYVHLTLKTHSTKSYYADLNPLASSFGIQVEYCNPTYCVHFVTCMSIENLTNCFIHCHYMYVYPNSSTS